MSRTNNDFGRSAEFFLVGREKESIGKTLGTFHSLPPELRKSLIRCARENAKKMKKWYDDALEQQRAARQRKEEIAMEHKLDKAKEDYINAIYFYEQYHSKRCWLTVEQARLE
jgi:histone acetyltransferase (RNA polymerase elongator complex component)